MPSRRTVVAGGAALLAGCLSSEPDDPNPENHVPDGWHDEPKQTLAEPIVRTAHRDSNLEDECPYAVAAVISELLRTRLEDPKTPTLVAVLLKVVSRNLASSSTDDSALAMMGTWFRRRIFRFKRFERHSRSTCS